MGENCFAHPWLNSSLISDCFRYHFLVRISGNLIELNMVDCRVLPSLMGIFWNPNDSTTDKMALNQQLCNLTSNSSSMIASLLLSTIQIDRNCSHKSLQILPEPGRLFFLYFYPFLLLLCVLVNLMNVRVYFQPFLRYCTTIRLLAAESLANLFYMLFLLPTVLTVHRWALTSEFLAKFYANTSMYFTFLVNTLGTFSAW